MKPKNLKEINEAFTLQAPSFETKTYHLSKQEYLKYAVERTKPNLNDAVLEVGAGTCALGRTFSPYVQKIVCLDATPAMLEVGKREAEKDGVSNITFLNGFAEELPFADNAFDIVVSRLAFHHFADVKKSFREMVRVLKWGGKLVLIDMTPRNESVREEVDRIERLRDPSHIRNLTVTEMRQLYEVNGLKLLMQEQTDIPVSLDGWMDLTKTPQEIRGKIKELMEKDMSGENQTGFLPYRKDDDIFFTHYWIFNLGIKLSELSKLM